MLRLVALLTGLLGCVDALHAQTPAKPASAEKKSVPAAAEKKDALAVAPPAQPRGVYATIDLRSSDEMIRRLNATAGTVRRPAIREVLKDPSLHMPPVLYALANALSGDDPEDAIFWYQVGRVRAVYDSHRIKDVTARSGVTILGRGLSVDLRRAMHFQRNQLLAIANRAVEWDAKNPRNYDQRWIALFGKLAHNSTGSDALITVPESEWPAILKRVQEAHLKSVEQFAAEPAPTR